MVVAAIAAGAVVTAGQTINNTASAIPVDPASMSGWDATSAMGLGGSGQVPEYLPLIPRSDPEALDAAAVDAMAAMAKGQRLVAERAAREANARRALFVRPAEGVLTSGFGARWGTTHWGIDIANSIGTPIVVAADGVVAEAGPASGFGMWVRILHADGSTTVYGHINRALVEEGERVRAGEEIAEMGNRGHSTGPHLHFEVWNADGQKINPLTWLRKHGIDL